MRKELEIIEAQMAAPGFWEKSQSNSDLLRRRRGIERVLSEIGTVRAREEEVVVFEELQREGEDASAELSKLAGELETLLDDIELKRKLGGENDPREAILTVHAGAGGTESQDWAQMLMRMYLRFCEAKGYKVDILEVSAGEEAGIKSATLLVHGDYAYGYLKSESGVHRLVRISPFDAAARRHTSFASVYVVPEIEDDIDIQIEDKDLRVDTYRSSGAGGQHVNVTDSAVRITHMPTNIVVSCQNERSQGRNRDTAMKVLRSRLYDLEMQKRKAEQDIVEAGKKDIAWGSQIRSYVLHPYRMVKDHRTNVEVGDADAVLDGRLERFIEGYLLQQATAAPVIG